MGKTKLLQWLLCILLVTSLVPVRADDATSQMFGDQTDGLPAAFGDFNSDELTDLFVIRNDGKLLEILLGQDKEPPMYRRASGLACHFGGRHITSVVPGDFNGDALMDVMVTVLDENRQFNDVVIIMGDMNRLMCKNNTDYLFKTIGQPLAIDYNKDMVIDLFGLNDEGRRTFWVFSKNNSQPEAKYMTRKRDFDGDIRHPHSHAYLDLNNDNLADLYITTNKSFEVWRGAEDMEGFVPLETIPLPPNIDRYSVIGQTVFLDVESKGTLDHLVPVCYDDKCKNSTILVYSSESWINLNVVFNEPGSSKFWQFPTRTSQPYTETITLRAGDFDMDGYPDLMTTLTTTEREFKSFFLKNVPCTSCSKYSRTFEIQWKELIPYNNNTVMGVFYDFQQDGVLDVIFVHYTQQNLYTVSAYKNTVNYDANFIKVMVVTGLSNKVRQSNIDGTLRKSGTVYGTNLPGPKILYATTTQEGDPRNAVATQMPQSAYFSLNLPYTIFGLGRTPNFIESLTVQVYGRQRDWSQLIPNSQMVVIPWPIYNPSRWKVQLFVTPSKLIFQSVLALAATCIVIALIIAILYWKERKEDHLEKLQEAHRFHFDAM